MFSIVAELWGHSYIHLISHMYVAFVVIYYSWYVVIYRMERVGSSPLSSILGPSQQVPHSMPNVTRLPWQQTSSPFVEQSHSLPISSVPTGNPVQP